MFEAVIKLYDLYRIRQSADPQFSNELGYEVLKRLKQIDYLLDRARAIEAALTPPGRDAEKLEAHRKRMFEIELHAEAFYYFASRIRTVLRGDSGSRYKTDARRQDRVVHCKALRLPSMI